MKLFLYRWLWEFSGIEEYMQQGYSQISYLLQKIVWDTKNLEPFSGIKSNFSSSTEQISHVRAESCFLVLVSKATANTDFFFKVRQLDFC